MFGLEFGVTLIGDGKVISFGVFKVPTYYSYNKVLRSHASSPRIGACGDESRCRRSRISLLEFGYERFEVGSAMRLLASGSSKCGGATSTPAWIEIDRFAGYADLVLGWWDLGLGAQVEGWVARQRRRGRGGGGLRVPHTK